MPDGVLNVITNAPQDAAEVVARSSTIPPSATSTSPAPRAWAASSPSSAARHLKPVLLELGGKAPLIVLDDADLDAAVNAAAFGAFMNQGQICMSTERIVVDKKIADDFVQRLAARAAALPLRDPSEGPAVLGSMVDPVASERVQKLIEDAQSKGAAWQQAATAMAR